MSDKNTSYDVAVIGGGPGGYVSAIRAAQHGLRVVCIEKQHMGGICLNWGCIPTKALLRCADVWSLLQHTQEYGIKIDSGYASFDMAEVVKRSRAVAAKLSSGVAYLMKKNNVAVIDGHARLKSANLIAIEGKDGAQSTIAAKNIIIATGARPRALPHIPIDNNYILDYKSAMIPQDMPASLLVVGSGAIGVEFASFYNAFGTKVTIVEMAARITPVEDADVSAVLAKNFTKRGIKLLTNSQVQKAEVKGEQVEVIITDSQGQSSSHKFDRVISAVGVVANTQDIGLENTRIKTEKGSIVIDDHCRTDEAGVYAIGDVVSPPWLAHKASHEGVITADIIAGKSNVHSLNRRLIPACTYCSPQIASIGLTEEQAKQEYDDDIKVGVFPLTANGKAIAMGETDGFVKTIFHGKTGELIGAHMIGAEVTEMIQGYAIAMTLETTEEELMSTVFPHPTISESMHESILDAYGKALHI